jgi:hypothetical protein
MSNRLLQWTRATAIAIAASSATGCPSESSDVQSAPVIVSGTPVFSPKSFAPGQYSDAWSFEITVTDASLSGAAAPEARLYFQEGSALLQFGTMPLTPSASAPNTWTGKTSPIQWCQLLKLPAGAGAPPSIFDVYVSDVGFPSNGQPRDLAAGHFDTREWVITCP